MSFRPLPPARLVAPLLVLCATPLAFTATDVPDSPVAEPSTVWSCWYNGKLSILCRLTAAPQASAAPDDPALTPYDGANSPSIPLPPIVAQIREQPGQLRDQTITIPIYSPPIGSERVEQLADSVMCGGTTSCRVDFLHEPTDFSVFEEVDPAID